MLAGPPNAGKSSLLNALARREAAIVSEEAGTTRDVIEVRLDLGGYPVIVSDTAGIREPQGSIEREGIRRTLAHAREADLVVWLSDASAADAAPPPPELAARGDKLLLRASNKTDVPGARAAPEAIAVSAKTGAGMDDAHAPPRGYRARPHRGQRHPPPSHVRATGSSCRRV